jgi:hypothetical protein
LNWMQQVCRGHFHVSRCRCEIELKSRFTQDISKRLRHKNQISLYGMAFSLRKPPADVDTFGVEICQVSGGSR